MLKKIYALENYLAIFDMPYIYKDKLAFSDHGIESLCSGDIVPYKTLWYNYGKNFAVFLNRLVTNQIYYFKDGKFDHVIEWDDDNDKEEVKSEFVDFYNAFSPVVIDRYGHRIKVNLDEFSYSLEVTNRDYSVFGAYIYLLDSQRVSKKFLEEFKRFYNNMNITLDKYYSWLRASEEDIKTVDLVTVKVLINELKLKEG